MKIPLLFLIVSLSLALRAQTEPTGAKNDASPAAFKRLKYLGVEAGMTFIEGEVSNMDYLRASMPSYYYGYSSNSITSWSYNNFIGIKSEIFSLNDRFGLSGGIRFSYMNSSIGRNSYLTSNPNYFYWLYREDGINTEYLRLKEINQRSGYIGIPLEIRYFTGRRPHFFHFYLKLGIEVKYLLKTKTDIVFQISSMESYEKDLISMLDKPERISAAVYGGGGFKFGRDQKPSLSIEACTPYIFLSSRSSGILQHMYGGGFQLNFQLPIKSKAL